MNYDVEPLIALSMEQPLPQACERLASYVRRYAGECAESDRTIEQLRAEIAALEARLNKQPSVLATLVTRDGAEFPQWVCNPPPPFVERGILNSRIEFVESFTKDRTPTRVYELERGRPFYAPRYREIES